MKFYLLIQGKEIQEVQKNPTSEDVKLLRNVDCYNFPITPVGTDLIKHFEIENLTEISENIMYKNGICYELQMEYETISNYPRELFNDGYKIEIQVPRLFLNQFFKIQFDKTDDMFERVLDEEMFLKFWEKSGFKESFLDENLLRKNEVETASNYYENELRKKKTEIDKRFEKSAKLGWIKKYGSEYLQNCFNQGYKNNIQYVIERAKQEFPEFKTEYPRRYTYDSCNTPSRSAIQEELRLQAEFPDFEFEIRKKENKEILTVKNYYEDSLLYKYID